MDNKNNGSSRGEGPHRPSNAPILPAMQMLPGGGKQTASAKRDRSPSTEINRESDSEKKPRASQPSLPSIGGYPPLPPLPLPAASLPMPMHMHMPIPNEQTIRLVKLSDGTYLCDVCKRISFATFQEGCMHEIVCKMIMQAKPSMRLTPQQQLALGRGDGINQTAMPPLSLGSFLQLGPPLPPAATAAASSANTNGQSLGQETNEAAAAAASVSASSTSATSSQPEPRRLRPVRGKAKSPPVAEPSSQTETKSFSVSLAPSEANRGILSDYNNLLLQNIELFEEVTTTTTSSSSSSSSTSGGANATKTFSRIGLRCIHCSGSNLRITAASFFPSSTAFMAPGIGNVGTRHFMGGRCPSVPAEIVEQMGLLKLTSQAQTKEAGRIGIDAYCRELAAKSGIVGYASGGIYHAGVSVDASGDAAACVEVPTKAAKKKKRKGSKSKKDRVDDTGTGDVVVPDRLSDSSEISGSTSAKSSARSRESEISNTPKESFESATSKAMDIEEETSAAMVTATTGTAANADADGATALEGTANGKENQPPAGSSTSTGDETSTAIAPKNVERYTAKPQCIDASSFVAGSIEYFWECKHCSSLPVPFRASGSVVFSSKPPNLKAVKGHLEKCQGLDALPIPRDAKISIGYGEKIPPIRISWDNKQLAKKTESIEQQRAALAAGKPWPPPRKEVGAILPSGEVNPGVEKSPLALKADLDLTTDFAYTTVTLLRKCYLTKAGGSRGGCSLGFPGLACSFCAGHPNERRFFYTSADHLRNSFSHIPSHVMSCPHAPHEVRRKMESLKALRNKHKATLEPGAHRLFIAQVWKRLHSKSNGLIDGLYDEDLYSDDSSDDDDDDTVEKEEKKATVATDKVVGKISGEEITASTNTSSDAMVSMPKAPAPAPAPTKPPSKPAPVSTRSSRSTAVRAATRPSGEIKYINTDLIKTDERHLTTDLAYLSLQLGIEVHNLRESDVAHIGYGEVGAPALKCKHCCTDEQIGRLFMPRSPHNLRSILLAISSHLCSSCPSCPDAIKAQLKMVGGQVREEQEAELKRGSALKFAEKVYSRLMMHDASDKYEDDIVPLPKGAASVVLEEDEAMVSGYTYLTLSQMMPCILDESGQGSRSTFPLGTPGLACKHCVNSDNGRTFFYRSCDVFSANASHIPNHILSCRFAPQHVKTILEQKKEEHSANRKNLDKGSQRAFFRKVWRRLNIYAREEKERRQQQADGGIVEAGDAKMPADEAVSDAAGGKDALMADATTLPVAFSSSSSSNSAAEPLLA